MNAPPPRSGGRIQTARGETDWCVGGGRAVPRAADGAPDSGATVRPCAAGRRASSPHRAAARRLAAGADPSSGGLPRAGVRLAAPVSDAHARAVGAVVPRHRRLPRKPWRNRAPGPRGFGASGAAGIPACAACPRIRGPVRAFLHAVRSASRPAVTAGNVFHRGPDRTSPRVCMSMIDSLTPLILARSNRIVGGKRFHGRGRGTRRSGRRDATRAGTREPAARGRREVFRPSVHFLAQEMGKLQSTRRGRTRPCRSRCRGARTFRPC